jgi:hypothetical protein
MTFSIQFHAPSRVLFWDRPQGDVMDLARDLQLVLLGRDLLGPEFLPPWEQGPVGAARHLGYCGA